MPPAMIRRPALVDALGRASGFAVVVAAAGYGKTTLLREWDAADPRPFVWVRAGETMDAAPTHGGALAARIAEARERAESAVLVFDDIHSATPDTVAALAELAEGDLGAGLVVVLSGRSIPPRLLSRLRLRGGLVELDEGELAFDEPETGQLLGPDAGPDAAAALVQRTAGWPAAIRLAAEAARDGIRPAEQFGGRDGLFRDYLHAEALDDADSATLDALRRLSALDALTGALCDAALDTTGSQRLLERLRAEHRFVSADDREGVRFRIHPLVREALLHELERDAPDDAHDVRARAAAWFARNGHAREALALNLRNGDRAAALSLLADVVLPMFYRGELAPLVDLIHGIGPEVAVESGYLATMFAYAGMMTGDVVCAQRWGREAQRYYAAHRFTTTDEEVAFFTFRAHLAPGGVAAMREDADRAASVVGESSAWRVPALMLAGIAAELVGDARSAARQLDQAIHLGAEDAATPGTIMAQSERVLLGEQPGSDARVSDLLAQAVAAAEDGFARYPQAGLVFALAAATAARAGHDDRARELFTAANALRPVLGRALPWLGAQMRLALARAAVALADSATARVAVKEAEELVALLPDARALRAEIADTARSIAQLPAAPGSARVAGVLTSAELRLLPLLPSHLSFEEIGRRLHVSRNTVKTQAISIYRKLGATSRSDAVDAARSIGLVDA